MKLSLPASRLLLAALSIPLLSLPGAAEGLEFSKDCRGTQALVEEFLKRDAEVGRTSSANYKQSFDELLAGQPEPGWDATTVIDSYQIAKCEKDATGFLVTVQYQSLGREDFSARNGQCPAFTPNVQSETLTAHVVVKDKALKIDKTPGGPHLSVATTIRNFQEQEKRQLCPNEIKTALQKLERVRELQGIAEHAKVVKNVDYIKEQGIGDFFIVSLSGLKPSEATDYLSRVEDAPKEAFRIAALRVRPNSGSKELYDLSLRASPSSPETGSKKEYLSKSQVLKMALTMGVAQWKIQPTIEDLSIEQEKIDIKGSGATYQTIDEFKTGLEPLITSRKVILDMHKKDGRIHYWIHSEL